MADLYEEIGMGMVMHIRRQWRRNEERGRMVVGTEADRIENCRSKQRGEGVNKEGKNTQTTKARISGDD